jgi:hypothetical protein
MGAGHQLVKLEAALGLATVGLGVVPAAMLLRPWGGASEAHAAKRSSFQLLLCFAAGLLSAAAALVHFAVIKQHADEYWLYGAFFVVLGLVQLAWGVLIVSVSSRTLYALGALGNAAVVAIFVVTRTVGTLVGP